jgi:sulfate/thiosulfate transport system substrate-binding protein
MMTTRIWMVVWLAACGGPRGDDAEGSVPDEARRKAARELVIGAYTTPREAYGEAILPGFAAEWEQRHGEALTFKESYQGSGAQARAIVEGFEADVAALSLAPDLQKIADAGLITEDWQAGPTRGMVTASIAVIAVRPGNPKGIRDWSDLAKPGVEVVTPNVRTSGGAMWNVAAIYGAATRGRVEGVAGGDAAAAEAFLGRVLENVKVMDKGARESMVTFENGVGDAAITYENEVLVARDAGKAMDYVVPASTILIENPVAVVDGYATKHGTRDVAAGFVAYLATPAAQAAFTRYGLRPVVGEVPTSFGEPADLFTIRDLGDWAALQADLFAKGALYDRALERAQK